jgi:hypothetical protein
MRVEHFVPQLLFDYNAFDLAFKGSYLVGEDLVLRQGDRY